MWKRNPKAHCNGIQKSNVLGIMKTSYELYVLLMAKRFTNFLRNEEHSWQNYYVVVQMVAENMMHDEGKHCLNVRKMEIRKFLENSWTNNKEWKKGFGIWPQKVHIGDKKEEEKHW